MSQNEITIRLQKPHINQSKVIQDAKRFNVLCNGRRWGKSVLAERLAIKTATHGKIVGFWSPTYKDLAESWKSMKSILGFAIKSKDEQLKQITVLGGGIIDCWSMDVPDSGRGRKYHLAIIDEFEKASKGEEAWKGAIRPTLTDYKGDAWIFSTPKGINRYFHELFNMKDKYDNWMSWQMPTGSNPYIDPDEIKEAKSQYDPIYFQQEYEAQFTTMADKPFLYCFEDRHISDKAQFNPNDTVYLSFDFNVDPSTCIVWQQGYNYIHYIDEIFLNDSNLFEVCDVIKAKYPNSHFMVTGDATGRNRSHLGRGNINSYKVIKQELKLRDSQFKLPTVNPPISERRTLCNAILANHPEILIHPELDKTIEDLRFTQVNDEGKIDTRQNKHRGHLLDAWSYSLTTFHANFIKKH